MIDNMLYKNVSLLFVSLFFPPAILKDLFNPGYDIWPGVENA